MLCRLALGLATTGLRSSRDERRCSRMDTSAHANQMMRSASKALIILRRAPTSWRFSRRTNHGPSLHIKTTSEFETLCGRLGRFCNASSRIGRFLTQSVRYAPCSFCFCTVYLASKERRTGFFENVINLSKPSLQPSIRMLSH